MNPETILHHATRHANKDARIILEYAAHAIRCERNAQRYEDSGFWGYQSETWLRAIEDKLHYMERWGQRHLERCA